MKIAAIFLLCIFAYAHSLSFFSLFNLEWNNFKLIYRKRYYNVSEETKRMSLYMENSDLIMKHNRLHAIGLIPFKLEMNKFGDMDTKEFVTKFNGLRTKNLVCLRDKETGITFIPPANVNLPDQVDWRTQGAVTKVKDQLECAASWSFASTGALEGQHFRQTNESISLSEQNLIDCSISYGNNGCHGGSMTNAYNYVKLNRGIDIEKYYPYAGTDHLKCEYDDTYRGATDRGYVTIESGNEKALKAAVATVGPISVGIDSSLHSFRFYKKGIYDDATCSNSHLDHAVLVVGYGTSKEGVDYWIVKNSWGTKWGEDGYIRMSRNKNNQCGIATLASYPLV